MPKITVRTLQHEFLLRKVCSVWHCQLVEQNEHWQRSPYIVWHVHFMPKILEISLVVSPIGQMVKASAS